MSGPPPKDPKTRSRRNRASTARTFDDDGTARPEPAQAPALPELEVTVTQSDGSTRQEPYRWHPRTDAWWARVWDSPMRDEFLWVDVEGLYRLAMLVDRFWRGAIDLAGEIRLQGQLFGLTPIDRRRLQWEVARVEKGERERGEQPPKQPVADPRSMLFAVEGGKKPTRRRRTAKA